MISDFAETHTLISRNSIVGPGIGQLDSSKSNEARQRYVTNVCVPFGVAHLIGVEVDGGMGPTRSLQAVL